MYYFVSHLKCVYILLFICVMLYLYFVFMFLHVFIYSIRHERTGGICLLVDDIDGCIQTHDFLAHLL